MTVTRTVGEVVLKLPEKIQEAGQRQLSRGALVGKVAEKGADAGGESGVQTVLLFMGGMKPQSILGLLGKVQ